MSFQEIYLFIIKDRTKTVTGEQVEYTKVYE